MKHIPGNKINYVFLIRKRNHPIKKPIAIDAWIIKQKAANHRKLQFHFERQNGICFYCGKSVILKPINDKSQPSKSHATVDHIIPRAAGGTDHRDNMLMACMKCNNGRGITPMEIYKERKLNEFRRNTI